jgi:hypothetical protein
MPTVLDNLILTLLQPDGGKGKMMINTKNNQFAPQGPSSMVFPSAKDLESQYSTERKTVKGN